MILQDFIKKNNTWNIRCLVDESFVPSDQRTNVLFCILTDFTAPFSHKHASPTAIFLLFLATRASKTPEANKLWFEKLVFMFMNINVLSFIYVLLFAKWYHQNWKQICTLTKVNRIKEDWIVKKFISTPCRFSKSQYNLRTNLKAISLSFLTNRLIFIYVLSPVRFYWCKNLPPVGTKKQIRGQKLLEGFGTC